MERASVLPKEDQRKAFVAYVMHKARTWRPECDACFYTKVSGDIEEEWVRPMRCTCLGLDGLTMEELDAFQAIVVQLACYTGKQKAIQFDLKHEVFNFERTVAARYPRDIRVVDLYDWRNYHVHENKECILTVENYAEKNCACCGLLEPICAVWLKTRRTMLSLCLKHLGICKDMRIYIAKLINCKE